MNTLEKIIEEYQGETRSLELNGTEIYYYVSGQEHKETIVFLHPAFSDHHAFDYQLAFFSQYYQVITIDLIGHGLSKAKESKDKIDASSEHIYKILAKEGVTKTHVVGVSMGSLVAQYFAYKHADCVKSLTVLGGYNIHKNNPKVAKAQQAVNMKLLFRLIFSVNSFRKKVTEISTYTEKGASLFMKSSTLYERKSLLVMQGLQKVIQERTYELKTPLLIITGEHDIPLAKEMANDWHNKMKDSQQELIQGAGHCANMDTPKKFNQLLLDFVSKNQ